MCTCHVTIVGPGAELHEAGLLVEWEVLNVDLAEGLVDGWWLPQHLARVVQDGLRHDGHLIITVGTGTNKNIYNQYQYIYRQPWNKKTYIVSTTTI